MFQLRGNGNFAFYQNANKFETALLVRKLDADDFVCFIILKSDMSFHVGYIRNRKKVKKNHR